MRFCYHYSGIRNIVYWHHHKNVSAYKNMFSCILVVEYEKCVKYDFKCFCFFKGDIQLPKLVKPPLPTNTPLITSLPPSAVDWTVKPSEREKYNKLFDSLQPLNGLIPGNKVCFLFHSF